MRRLAVLAALALAAGCGKRESTPAPPAPGAARDAAMAPDGSAPYAAEGKRPVNPRRATAPPTMATAALAVGAKAPAVSLAATTGTFELGPTLAAKERVLLVFYRGDW
ncbi:MAG: hypothetical protein IPL61_22510 [Myxococcales bacterium]|nr:hypothetical protein [Myxococcales bacterium]